MPDHDGTRAMSAEPCEWCGEHFPIRHKSQIHHLQNPECYRQARQKKSRDCCGHQPGKQPRALKSTVTTIHNPLRLAAFAGRRYKWLKTNYLHDFNQSLALACLMAGIEDPYVSDVTADISLLSRMSDHVLRGLARDLGAVQRKGKWSIPTVDLESLANYAQGNWPTTWKNA